MWYVYFLELANSDIYVGSTNDLKRRFASHAQGEVISTRRFLPAKLRSYIGVETELIARQLVRYFKSGSGRAFEEAVLVNAKFYSDPASPRSSIRAPASPCRSMIVACSMGGAERWNSAMSS